MCTGFSGSQVKNPPVNAGDVGELESILGSGRSPGGGNGNPLKYSCLYNSMNKGAWWATVHGVAKGQTRLSDFHFHFLKKEMATHSSILAWKISWTEEPGGLQSMADRKSVV